jgi:VWFA-related protein
MSLRVRGTFAALAAALAVALVSVPSAQDALRPEQPRFRAGANLVRVDAYVSQDGQAVTTLAAEDFEVLEDGVPQRVESFELIRARPPVPQSARVEPSTVADARAMAAAPESRVFVVFLDVRHVHLEGSFKAANPMIKLLDRVIGQDDLVGVMTPDMSARNLTLARRTTTIETFFRNNWYWGERQRVNTSDPREQELQSCYSDAPRSATEGLAQELIDRRRERQTLDSIEDLIQHLEGIREERKFVILLSEGWRLPRRDDRLGRALGGYVPKVDPVSIGPEGRLTTGPPVGSQGFDACERERQRLAAEDLEQDFRTLLQRANRANVSFYTVDPRGLAVFDEDLSLRRATNIVQDQTYLVSRQTSLRELAENTDGAAVLNTSKLDEALGKMLADIGSYYLLGYYSSNSKLDGKFRKLTVRVKRPGLSVRARPGYLAPTTEDVEAAARAMAAATVKEEPPGLKRAFDALGATRANVPLRMQTAATGSRMWLTTEVDAAAIKSVEWQKGGQVHVTIEHERGGSPPIARDLPLAPGQRAISLLESSDHFAPGRYVVRLSIAPLEGALPLQLTSDVIVPDTGAMIAPAGLARRRGPATGLNYVATADGRYQRTERVRFEVPRLAAGGTVSARVLNRSGQNLPLTVTLSERQDEASSTTFIVADLMLAALAQGEYVLEVTVDKQSAAYGFRIVP